MKIIRKNQTKKFKNSDTCIATEYPIDEVAINVACVEVLGRYPEKGRAMNEKCKEMVYVEEGNGKVVVEEKEIILDKNDLILIEPNERYYWEGNFKLIISCAPAWNPKQYKVVTE